MNLMRRLGPLRSGPPRAVLGAFHGVSKKGRFFEICVVKVVCAITAVRT